MKTDMPTAASGAKLPHSSSHAAHARLAKAKRLCSRLKRGGRYEMRHLVLTLLLVQSSHSAPAYLDADNLDEAAAMIYVESRVVEGTRKMCGESFPAQKRLFDYYVIIWVEKNRPETDGVAQYVTGLKNSEGFLTIGKTSVEASLALVKRAASVTSKDAVCLSFAEDLKVGQRNVSVRTPRASQFLRTYLGSHPVAAAKIDRRNMTSGCVKQAFNREVDFDAASSSCSCVTDTMYRELTASELETLDQLTRQKADVSSFPPLVRALPKLATCQHVSP